MSSENQQNKRKHPLLDVKETAKFLRLKESTVRAWILKKKLPFVKLGRKVFVRRVDLENLIDKSVVPAKATGTAA